MPVGIDPGWDYNVGKSQPEQLRKRLAEKRDTLARSLGGEPPADPPPVALAHLDVETADGVRDVLTAIAVQRKDLLPHGVKAVVVTDDAYLAASDQRGYFALSRRVDPALGKSGYTLVTQGVTAIRDGRPLAFAEEYGLETLWHEILHNGQARRVPDGPLEVVRLAQGLHQALSRQTYPELLRLLGAEACHARIIREHGPAYPRTVARLSALLQRVGGMDAEFRITPELLGALRDLDAAADFPALADDLVRMLKPYGSGEADIEAALQAIAAGMDP